MRRRKLSILMMAVFCAVSILAGVKVHAVPGQNIEERGMVSASTATSSRLIWKVNGEKISGLVPIYKSIAITVEVSVPSGSDLIIVGWRQKSRGWGAIYNDNLSADKKTLTFKYVNNQENGKDTIQIDTKNSQSQYAIEEMAVGTAPMAPTSVKTYSTITYNSFEPDTRWQSPGIQLEVQYKKGSKWVTGTTGLKPNKKYSFRARTYSGTGDDKICSDWVKWSAKTGVKSKPKVKSVKAVNVQQKRIWIDGYWNHGTWVKGRYDYSYKCDLKVTLSQKAPSGVLGLVMKDHNVTSGTNTYTAKGRSKTYTFKNFSFVNKNAKYSFKFYSDKTLGGYSPESAAKTYKLK